MTNRKSARGATRNAERTPPARRAPAAAAPPMGDRAVLMTREQHEVLQQMVLDLRKIDDALGALEEAGRQ